MKIWLERLEILTRKSTERLDFSRVTFIHGPVSTGKSTVARLVDYCMGGSLEWTPAIRKEFVSATLYLRLGEFDCSIERASDDGDHLRVSWSGPHDVMGSVNAPLTAQVSPLVDAEVYNFSDLVFHLSGVEPIKVRKRSRDFESPLIRLSIRDLLAFSYLDQLHLDSSFFRLEDPIRGRKSQDAMRFFTGLHSEALSELEGQYMKAQDDQRSKRNAVSQIREFMERFDLGSELDVEAKITGIDGDLALLRRRRDQLHATRATQLHPTDELRDRLRDLGANICELRRALLDAETALEQQNVLRSELVTAKSKAKRVERAGQVLDQVEFERCPRCGSDVSDRLDKDEVCRLCGSGSAPEGRRTPAELEVIRRDLNNRIDEITDAIRRREAAITRTSRDLRKALDQKKRLDDELQEALARYDSAFVESVRASDREIATLEERLASYVRLQEMPRAIAELQEEAGALQGKIDRLRSKVEDERKRLRRADENIKALEEQFMRTMLAVGFPGVSNKDKVELDPRNWRPRIVHGEQAWDFWDAGSGGKKTLFNVCFALALHEVALERGLPVPTVLIVDSPTKNISEDENPALVRSLYDEIYRLAEIGNRKGVQFLLIDSDLVEPQRKIPGFTHRRMAGTPAAPSLIPYYTGP